MICLLFQQSNCTCDYCCYKGKTYAGKPHHHVKSSVYISLIIFKAFINLFKPLIDLLEAFFHLLETLIHAFEAFLHQFALMF